MKKCHLEKIYEPDEDKVHYVGPLGSDQVTLCGLTDFIQNTIGYTTTKPLNCAQCERIVNWIYEHKKPIAPYSLR